MTFGIDQANYNISRYPQTNNNEFDNIRTLSLFAQTEEIKARIVAKCVSTHNQ